MERTKAGFRIDAFAPVLSVLTLCFGQMLLASGRCNFRNGRRTTLGFQADVAKIAIPALQYIDHLKQGRHYPKPQPKNDLNLNAAQTQPSRQGHLTGAVALRVIVRVRGSPKSKRFSKAELRTRDRTHTSIATASHPDFVCRVSCRAVVKQQASCNTNTSSAPVTRQHGLQMAS